MGGGGESSFMPESRVWCLRRVVFLRGERDGGYGEAVGRRGDCSLLIKDRGGLVTVLEQRGLVRWL